MSSCRFATESYSGGPNGYCNAENYWSNQHPSINHQIHMPPDFSTIGNYVSQNAHFSQYPVSSQSGSCALQQYLTQIQGPPIAGYNDYNLSGNNNFTQQPLQSDLQQLPIQNSHAVSEQAPYKPLYPQNSLCDNQRSGFCASITVAQRDNGTFDVTVKRQRTAFTDEQVNSLEVEFANKNYITRQERQALADRLSLSDKTVKTWFQNRRSRQKKYQRDRDNATDGIWSQDGTISLSNSTMYEPVSPASSSDSGEEVSGAFWNAPDPEESLRLLLELREFDLL